MRLTMPSAAAPLLLCAALAACSNGGSEVSRGPADPLSALDAEAVGEVMLAVAEPEEAVLHFQRVAAADPSDPAARRGLATSLVRAGRHADAVPHWRALAATPAAADADRVALAEALVRTGEWSAAREALGRVPDSHRTARRYRLEAMMADADEAWTDADRFYEAATGLSARPAGILNNWGYSKLNRGDGPGAERLFERALAADPDLFTAKNNLAMARGARGDYEVPLVPMTQTERATVLHTLALAAVRSGDVAIGRALLRDAVETHPQHFEAAAQALAALEVVPAGSEAPARAAAARAVPTNALDAPASEADRPGAARVIDAAARAGEAFP